MTPDNHKYRCESQHDHSKDNIEIKEFHNCVKGKRITHLFVVLAGI